MVDDVAQRARQWRLDELRSVCDHLAPWSCGLVARAHQHPNLFRFNTVLVQRHLDGDLPELLSFVERALLDLRHRSVEFSRAEDGLHLGSELRARGWQVTSVLRMRHELPHPPAVPKSVQEVDYRDVHELRLAWHEEDFPGVAAEDHFRHAESLARRRGVRVLAVRGGGGSWVGFAHLEQQGEAAEITDLYVRPDQRGRGLGSSLAQAAIAAALPVRDLWIEADAAGRPQRLYRRLGFRPVLRELRCLRLDPPAAGAIRTLSTPAGAATT